MDDVGLALMMAADEYAETDNGARLQFDKLRATLDQSHQAPE